MAYSKDLRAFGGNDDWISTDERDNVRDIGPMCISDMETRMGIKEGDTHRGEIDWSNLSFVEDGIGLDEVDLIPQTHPEREIAVADLEQVMIVKKYQ